MHKIAWDDLRFVLGVAEHGSIASAARALGVDRTTVLRRIKRFETRLECKLFERSPLGYALTLEAEKLLDAARGVERTLLDLERQIAGRELRLEGDIRVTTTDALFSSTVAPHLARFAERHPSIRVEIALTNQRLNLTRRDADVAIRPTEGAPRDLVGLRLADIEFGLFASPDYAGGAQGVPRESLRWLGVEEPLHATPAAKWLSRNVPDPSVCVRAGSFLALRRMAECGMGVALLPLKLGDQSDGLVRMAGPLDDVRNLLWILTHADLAQSARIRAFVDHFAQAFGVAAPAKKAGRDSP